MPFHCFPFTHDLASLFFFRGHVVAVFSMVLVPGWSYIALPGLAGCGALSGLAALCLARVSVVVVV